MNIVVIILDLGGEVAERIAQIIGDYYVEKIYYFLLETMIKQVYSVKGEIVYTGIKNCVNIKRNIL